MMHVIMSPITLNRGVFSRFRNPSTIIGSHRVHDLAFDMSYPLPSAPPMKGSRATLLWALKYHRGDMACLVYSPNKTALADDSELVREDVRSLGKVEKQQEGNRISKES